MCASEHPDEPAPPGEIAPGLAAQAWTYLGTEHKTMDVAKAAAVVAEERTRRIEL